MHDVQESSYLWGQGVGQGDESGQGWKSSAESVMFTFFFWVVSSRGVTHDIISMLFSMPEIIHSK